jgi:hypothetical protein
MGDVLKYEVNPNYTREVITLQLGLSYPAGSVLGRITASGKYTLSPATAADGSQTAVAVLLYPVNATLADAVGIVVTRGPAIVSRAALAYEATVNDAAKIAAKITQLAAVGIIARDGV